ncbi:hypothetical protein Fmac_027952 [Flemingia macrophylla]|uniref:CUE domain-containing protein n=1 Tax=Flemingia macrophylla TaxID=520843 RepID=A0ABD1LJF9_9FABA
MGFNSVYRSLQEIFPQVDARLLRAVAIEHPKDADLAAGIVLADVIPFMSKKLPPATAQDNNHGAPLNVEVESEEEGNRLRHRQLIDHIDVGPSSAPHSISAEITKSADHSIGPDLNVALGKSTLSNGSNTNDDTDKFLEMDKELNVFQNAEDNFDEETLNMIAQEMATGFSQEDNGNFDHRQLHADVDCEILISSGICPTMEPERNFLDKEDAATKNNGNSIGNHLNEEWVDFVVPSANDYDATTSHRLEECKTNHFTAESFEDQTVYHVQENEDNLQLELDDTRSSSAGGNTNDAEDDIGGKNAVSEYSQVCRIDLLEETIDEAKTNKKTLFSSMESLINLMKEVELKEKAAEQANLEAATGGSNIRARIAEYKTMLVQAKEANDMHAGEVYGEKAILATELKELQSRLLSLSDERDKSLAILDEMHQILEARLATAEELRKAAEHDKLEKEDSARKALVEQEALVEKVLHESRRLQQEAEENSKVSSVSLLGHFIILHLREFLMDRGRVVDMLQGEISVICQDIRLLKEKFDANLPLNKSFTSSQTTCKLASSGSSHKSLASSEHSDSYEIAKTSRVAPIERLPSESGHDVEKSKDDQNALDDGWDIFEKDAELNSGAY